MLSMIMGSDRSGMWKGPGLLLGSAHPNVQPTLHGQMATQGASDKYDQNERHGISLMGVWVEAK